MAVSFREGNIFLNPQQMTVWSLEDVVIFFSPVQLG